MKMRNIILAPRLTTISPLIQNLTSRSFSSRTEVIVIRHGETSWNRDLRVQGTTDVALNDRGMEQAMQCAEFFKHKLLNCEMIKPSAVYSSELSRSSETATAIANVARTLVRKDAALNEWNLGVIEGMRKEEAAEHFPEDWQTFSQWCNPYAEQDIAARRILDGESMEDVRRRAVAFLEKECREADEGSAIICVTHGGVLGQLLRHVVSQQNDKLQHSTYERTILDWANTFLGRKGNQKELQAYARPANASISRFYVEGDEWEILEWANTSHLDEAPARADYNTQ